MAKADSRDRKWTAKERAFIKEWAGLLDEGVMAEHLNRHLYSVHAMRQKIAAKKVRK